MNKNTASKQAAAVKLNNKNEEKNMSKKIKSYIVKENTTVKVIRFNNPNNLSDGHTCVDELKTDKPFIFGSTYVIAKCSCPCCDEISYIFDHCKLGPVEINEEDLIMTELSIDEYYAKYPSENHNNQRVTVDKKAV